MTPEEIHALPNRQLDSRVAEKVLGYKLERVLPSWYPVEVLLFYIDDYLVYSYDERSCNAMMFRNGIDESQGYAQPLPFFTTGLETAWSEVRPRLSAEAKSKMGRIIEMCSEDAARWICEVAVLESQEQTRI